MKKLLFIISIFVFAPNLYCAIPPCSFIIDSGSLDNFLEEENNKIKSYWENEIGRVGE